MAILIKQIPNFKAPLDAIEREIHILGINIVDSTKEIFIPYEIKCFKDGIDVSLDMNRTARPFHIHNGMTIYERTREFGLIDDPNYLALVERFNGNNPQNIPNPDYISEEETPGTPTEIPNPDYITQEMLDSTEKYKVAPAYDQTLAFFRENPDLLWVFLEGYIMENYGEGWFDNR